MIKIEFDSANESIMVESLKELIVKNPILLQNIIEPSVNGIISDSNVPEKIKEIILQLITAESINGNINEAIISYLQEHDIGSQINSTIEEQLSNNQGPYNDIIKEQIEGVIEEHVDRRSIESSIDDAIDNAVGDANIGQMVEQAVDELNLEEIASAKIADEIDNIEFEPLIMDAVDSKLHPLMDQDQLRHKIKEAVNDKINNINISESTVIEIIKEMLQPNLNKLIADQVSRVVPSVTDKTECSDTIIIKSKPEATPALLWMFKFLMSEKTIVIESVNGVPR